MLRFSTLSLILVGCGSSVESAATSDTGVADGAIIDTGIVDAPDGGRPETGPGVQPPARPSSTSSGGATKWFAVRRLQLGISNKATGAKDAQAWKQFGYDLDSRTTTREDSKLNTNSCKRRAGSATSVLTDGELGRDNNFAQHFMSVVKSLKSDVEDVANTAIAAGQTTLLLRLDNVGPADNASVPGALFVAGPRSMPPKWDGSDQWPINSTSVDATKESLQKFPNGYMSGGVWVSGDSGKGTAAVPIPFMPSLAIRLPLEGTVLSFEVTSGANGTIAGASNPAKFIEVITPLMRSYGICPGNATFEQVAATTTQSADLVAGAPGLQDVTKECDAMSVGIGFTAAPVAATDVIIPPPAPPPDECPPP